MKYVISTKEFEKANITEPQIFAILLACSCGDKSISSIFDELFKSDVLRKNMFTNEIEVNPFFLKIVREILYKTDPTIPDVEELDELAVRLMNIYPRGKKDGTNVYWRGNKKEIESMDICKWKINEICCNDECEYLADYPYPYCKCENKKQCKYFEKEDGK